MKKILAFLLLLPSISLFASGPFCCKGRVDVGPAYLHIKALENGVTAHTYDLFGVRSDSTLLFLEGSGLCFKPSITYADKDAKFFGYGLGIGYYLPIGKSWYVIPTVGGSITNFSTDLTLVIGGFPFEDTHEWIHSKSLYVGGEVGYNLYDELWISYVYQYAWARSQTNLSNSLFPDGVTTLNGSSEGSNMALSLDYYWKCWSFGVAAGYNSSLDKERFGIEGYGVKLSIGYCLK